MLCPIFVFFFRRCGLSYDSNSIHIRRRGHPTCAAAILLTTRHEICCTTVYLWLALFPAQKQNADHCYIRDFFILSPTLRTELRLAHPSASVVATERVLQFYYCCISTQILLRRTVYLYGPRKITDYSGFILLIQFVRFIYHYNLNAYSKNRRILFPTVSHLR